MPILGLDIDDTSGHYMRGLKSFIVKKEARFFEGMSELEIAKHFPDLTSYDNFAWSLINGDRDKFVAYHSEAVENGLFRTLTPIDGVSKYLWKLKREHDFENYVITSRFVKDGQNARVLMDTGLWLDETDIPYRDIMFVRNKVDVVADVYIDDSPKNIDALRAAGRVVIIFDQPYNRHLGGLRAHSWEEAYQILSTMF